MTRRLPPRSNDDLLSENLSGRRLGFKRWADKVIALCHSYFLSACAMTMMLGEKARLVMVIPIENNCVKTRDPLRPDGITATGSNPAA